MNHFTRYLRFELLLQSICNQVHTLLRQALQPELHVHVIIECRLPQSDEDVYIAPSVSPAPRMGAEKPQFMHIEPALYLASLLSDLLTKDLHPTLRKPIAGRGECVILHYVIDTALSVEASIVDFGFIFGACVTRVRFILGRRKELDIFYMLYVVSIDIQNNDGGGAEFGRQKCLEVAFGKHKDIWERV